MKNLDFKQIKSIKTPESWIENATNIPHKNKKPVPFYLKPYFIASVASLVLCCTICLTVFFSTNNNATVPVAPNTTQTTTDVTDNTQPTETVTTTPNVIIPIPTNTVQESTTAIINTPNSTASSKPAQTQHQPIETNSEPSEKTTTSVEPTENTETTEPIIQTEPTEESTENHQVTEPPTALPVEPTVTEPMVTEPMEPPTESPTIHGGPPPTETYATIYFTNVESRGFIQSNVIYCHIETPDGDSTTEKFTASEKAYWNKYGGYAFYQAKLKLYTQYNITFYDEYGNTYAVDIYYYGGIINI